MESQEIKRCSVCKMHFGDHASSCCVIGSMTPMMLCTQDNANPKDLIGAKKVPLELIPSVAEAHESLALLDGAKKYGPYNWREKSVKASIYVAACRRHLAAWFDGEENAEDSGCHHLGHARACLGILLDALEGNCLVDDRPKPGAFPAVANKLQQIIEKKSI